MSMLAGHDVLYSGQHDSVGVTITHWSINFPVEEEMRDYTE